MIESLIIGAAAFWAAWNISRIKTMERISKKANAIRERVIEIYPQATMITFPECCGAVTVAAIIVEETNLECDTRRMQEKIINED